MLIRIERPEDHRVVEELTREAFWNLYIPGCDEHFLLHTLRQAPEFIQALCLVGVVDEQIVANIAYSEAIVRDSSSSISNNSETSHKVLMFGPVSVLPAMQGKGYGSALIAHSIQAARELGYAAIVIEGDPRFYRRFGFENGHKYGICAADGSFPKALQALELRAHGLSGVSGVFEPCGLFSPDQTACAAFDKTFAFKEKYVTPSQRVFSVMTKLKHDDPDPADTDTLTQTIIRRV